MALEDNGFFSPGTWGFMEGWPRGAEAPVFDICHGETHVARLLRDRGEWRVVLRPTAQITSDLASLVHVLEMVKSRLAAVEAQIEEQAARDAHAREASAAVAQAVTQLIVPKLAAAG